MSTSRVPAAVDALLATLRAAPALSEVLVIDGPPINNLSGGKRLYIGWQRDAGDIAVSGSQEFNSAGARTRDENFAIACYAEVWSGDTDMQLQRNGAYGLLAVVEDALRATNAAPEAPTLSGSVLWSQLTTGDLVQQQTDAGACAGLNFTVACRARI